MNRPLRPRFPPIAVPPLLGVLTRIHRRTHHDIVADTPQDIHRIRPHRVGPREPVRDHLARRPVGGLVRQVPEAGAHETDPASPGLDVADLGADLARLGGGHGGMVAAAAHALAFLDVEGDVQGECVRGRSMLGVEAGEDVGAGAGFDGREGEEERDGGVGGEEGKHCWRRCWVKAVNKLLMISSR